jgi:hypothetical protein
MKIKKSELARVESIVSGFRTQGVPYWILLHEAHKLTEGVVGVPFSHPKQNDSIHLAEVATKMLRAKN